MDMPGMDMPGMDMPGMDMPGMDMSGSAHQHHDGMNMQGMPEMQSTSDMSDSTNGGAQQ